MNKNFWQSQIEQYGKIAFLAPMDGYGDSAYRQSMKRVAPHIYTISEFYSADWLIHSKFLASSVLPHTDIEKPLIVQIFWKDPIKFAQAAKIIQSYGVAWIDVNMGCPAKKVVRSWHGSSLLIHEQTAFDIVKALDEATDLPISVKTRLSFDGNQDLISFAQWLQKAGAKLITIHGRTAQQGYTGKADFTNIYELKKNLDIPVICNGDILNYTDGMNKVQNLDGFMIGRASFWNPWCFLGQDHLTQDQKKYMFNNMYQPTLEEILDAMEFHASTLVSTKWEKKWSLEIRKHLVQYLKSFPWVKEYRKKLVTTESFSQTQDTIHQIRTNFSNMLTSRPWLWEML